MSQHQSFLDFAHALADSAREITLGFFRQNLTVTKKADGSPVTLADQKTEKRLRACIQKAFPTHGIIGEEQSAKATQSQYEWIIDPIDGTKSFISGYPLFGTLICLLADGKPIVSVVDIPAQDERFYATVDSVTRFRKSNGAAVPICTRTHSDLSTAIMYSTEYAMFSPQEHKRVAALRKAVTMVRYNGDCYLYAMLASGWIDIVLESDLKVYDFLPLVLIIEQAGGVMTDWHGNQLDKKSGGQVVASANPQLHRAALSLIHI